MRAYPLAVIVIAQLFGTSLWFSANSAGADLIIPDFRESNLLDTYLFDS